MIGELDGDSNLEIIFATYASDGKLFVINDTGTDVDNFPIVLNEKVKEEIPNIYSCRFNHLLLNQIIVSESNCRIDV